MKLAEAWRLSRIPYREVVFRSLAEERGRMWWGAFGRSHFDKEAQSDVELTNRALRIARFDKVIVSIFSVIASVMPFTALYGGSSSLWLASSISLSLAISFGFTVLYAIQTLSSFVSAESSRLLSTLPLGKRDFSLITLFSFIRSVDYMVAGAIITQVVLVAYSTASPIAIALTFLASSINEVFAVAVALWFSRLFYSNLMRGGRSRGGTALRLAFILMWGSLLLGVGLLLSIPWYIVPQLGRALLNLNQVSTLFFCILYPFSAGITISNLVQTDVALSAAATASVAMAAYVLIAILTTRWTLETVRRVSQGTGVKITRAAAKDFSVKTRGPLMGYVIKDLRTSSRNPATAFFFALPVLETAIVSLLTTNYQMLKASTILVATVTGGIFTLLIPLALLNAEGTGLEYTKTLPINASRIIASKALITTGTYAPVPITLLVLSFVKQISAPLTILIPCITTLSIISASVFEIELFLASAAKGKIRGVIRDLEKLLAGVAIILVPQVAYATVYFASLNHGFAILVMCAAASGELVIAIHTLKRYWTNAEL
jgi:predicted permease